jgi:hypothetical protein
MEEFNYEKESGSAGGNIDMRTMRVRKSDSH